MSRAERRRLARERASAGHLDPDFVCDAERVAFVVETAREMGVDFALEGDRLAVGFPLDISPIAWRSLQAAILDNLRFIVGITRAREAAPRRRP
jgi:hypothetical protein